MESVSEAEFFLRLLEHHARSLGVEVLAFEVRVDSRRALGRVTYGAMSPRQRYLVRGAARLLLALAEHVSAGEARELLLVERPGRSAWSFRLDWVGLGD